MNRAIRLLMFLFALVFLLACEPQPEKTQQVIPKPQLDALQQAKNLESELLEIQQQKNKQLQQQGL